MPDYGQGTLARFFFAYARQAIKLGGWKKLFPGAHIEQMRSDFAANERYCSKEGQLIEHGQHPRQGERTILYWSSLQLSIYPFIIHNINKDVFS